MDPTILRDHTIFDKALCLAKRHFFWGSDWQLGSWNPNQSWYLNTSSSLHLGKRTISWPGGVGSVRVTKKRHQPQWYLLIAVLTLKPEVGETTWILHLPSMHCFVKKKWMQGLRPMRMLTHGAWVRKVVTLVMGHGLAVLHISQLNVALEKIRNPCGKLDCYLWARLLYNEKATTLFRSLPPQRCGWLIAFFFDSGSSKIQKRYPTYGCLAFGCLKHHHDPQPLEPTFGQKTI